MAFKKGKRRPANLKPKPVKTNCLFCKEKRSPDYKQYEELKKYITDRARINPKTRTGLCAKHQRRLAVAIKRARQIGLLPFTASL